MFDQMSGPRGPPEMTHKINLRILDSNILLFPEHPRLTG